MEGVHGGEQVGGFLSWSNGPTSHWVSVGTLSSSQTVPPTDLSCTYVERRSRRRGSRVGDRAIERGRLNGRIHDWLRSRELPQRASYEPQTQDSGWRTSAPPAGTLPTVANKPAWESLRCVGPSAQDEKSSAAARSVCPHVH